MRRGLVALAIGLVLTLVLSGSALAAPILSETEGGTLSVYGESIFGIVYFAGVTYTLADGCGLGIGTILDESAFELLTINGTLSLGPVVLDIQALTDGSFDEYLGQAGLYLELELGPVTLYPGVGMFFLTYDLDDDGSIEPDEIAHGDPYFAFELQFQAGQFTVYTDAMASFGDEAVFLGRIGLNCAF